MKSPLRALAFAVFATAVVGGSLLVGPGGSVNSAEAARWVAGLLTGGHGTEPDSLLGTVLLGIRLPRILLTFLVGAALAASGAGLQAIFRNPLVDPYIMGISSGAAFGAALAIASGVLPVQPLAFLGGGIAVAASYLLASHRRNSSTVAMILAGVVVSGVFTAGLTVVQFVSDPFKLQSIVHWTMGSLHTADWGSLRAVAPPAMAGTVLLLLWSWRLNLLAIGEDEAMSAGVHPGRERLLVLLAATVATSSCVAVAGVIAFYGLFVPHGVRWIAGADNRRVVPLSAIAGGTLLVLLDDLARSLTSYELPIGVFTMLLGAPFFIVLMRRARIGWGE